MAGQDQVGDRLSFMNNGRQNNSSPGSSKVPYLFTSSLCAQKPAEERIPSIFGRFGAKFFGPMIDAIIGVADPCKDGVSSAGAVAAAKSVAREISHEDTQPQRCLSSRSICGIFFSLILAEHRCTMCW